jgi:two-component system cell cycle sensor histidine kinase/response regulator CckA
MQDDDQRLRQAIRVGNIGIFDHDHEADRIFWSLELRQIYGWDPDEPATLEKVVSHVHPDDAPWVVAAVRRAHDPAGDGAFDIEHRIFDRQGRLRWVQTRSRTNFGSVLGRPAPSRTIGAVQDITARRVAEERLRVLDAVLSSTARAIAIADPDGTLTFANAAVHQLWGYSRPDELVGRSLFQLWPTPEDPAAALARLREERIQRVETRASRVDGTCLYLEITAEAVCDAAGTLKQALVTFSDITDRKELEGQLMQAQKMESIGRLAGGVAHDFNNLLTVIAAGLDSTLQPLAADDPTRVRLVDVVEATQSAAALTRQLLAFSRKEIIAPKVLDLNEILRRTEKMILRLIGEDIELKVICGDELTPVRFDPGQAEQILINLVVNARDAMPTGGRLTIETSNVWVDGESGSAEGGADRRRYALLAVSDNGTGMSGEVRAHLFEPFFTTKGPGRGTGLGLPMVYGAVQQNGGRIEVCSEPNQGSTFRIYLPGAEGVPAQRPPARPPVPDGRRDATTLLVEDDPRVRRLTKEALTRLGYRVHAFGDGLSALDALPSLRPVPDLLITDVIMPGMNGKVLATRVAEVLPQIRVLFVSGYTQDFIVDRGVLKTGIEFLAKPYSLEQLAQRARDVLDV